MRCEWRVRETRNAYRILRTITDKPL